MRQQKLRDRESIEKERKKERKKEEKDFFQLFWQLWALYSLVVSFT
jgi:hypothetical protein